MSIKIKRRDFLKFSAAAATVVGMNQTGVFTAAAQQQTEPYKKPFFLPDPKHYPNFSDRNAIIKEAQRISDALNAYVKNWFDGIVSAQIPENLLPVGYDNKLFKNFYLQRPEEITPEQQWGYKEPGHYGQALYNTVIVESPQSHPRGLDHNVRSFCRGARLAEPINFSSIRGSFNDPNCTYLVLPCFYAPFGSKVIIEGEFPHARFFDIQFSPSFHPEAYRYNGTFGVGEVPIVDVDIDPLPGNTNPFRVGADRNAPQRRYRVTADLAIGNPAELNAAFKPPTYRAPGNNRVAGAIFYQAPWGDPKALPWGHGRGLWDFGQIWVRYYAPDKAVGPLGGVPLPKVRYQLPDGREFFINADKSAWSASINLRKQAVSTDPVDPDSNSKTFGWDKMIDIFRATYGSLARVTGGDQAYVRLLNLGVAGRGEDVPAPGNEEPNATTCTYINYLTRTMSLNKNKICVLTGKLPTFPRTRNGEDVMSAAQARYWSLTGYDATRLPDADGFGGAALQSVMDDEIVLDARRRYIIVLSRSNERPRNAIEAAGVTWVEWGPTSTVSWTRRWMSVHPDWHFPQAPTEDKFSWQASWASQSYDPSIIGTNTQTGILGEYQPLVHYLSTAS